MSHISEVSASVYKIDNGGGNGNCHDNEYYPPKTGCCGKNYDVADKLNDLTDYTEGLGEY